MVDYGGEYGNSMDRSYNPIGADGNPNTEADWAKVDITTIGMSTPPMKDQLQSLKARIFQGVRKVELGFWGKGKGSLSQGSTTPEQMDSWHRRDIKELADFNKVELSTHVTPAVGNLSGLAQGGFSEEEREKAMFEIKRTVDFAADTTHGGAVVVHLGEYPRAMSEQENWKKDDKGDSVFQMYPSESEHAKQYVVDSLTGKFMGEISKDQIVYEPKWMTAKDWQNEQKDMGNGWEIVGKKDKNGVKINPDDWVDLDGNVINKYADPKELFDRRIPLWNDTDANFKTERRDFKFFKKEADDWNKNHPGKPKTAAMIFYETQLDNQILQNKGHSMFYAHAYGDQKDQLRKAKKALKEYENLEESIPEDERMRIAIDKNFRGYEVAQLFPKEKQLPSDALKHFITQTKRQMQFAHESSSAGDAKAAELLDMKSRLQSLENFATQKTADTIARAAEYAMVKSKKLEKPLFISPENIFAETYGSHPEELKSIILQSREAFSKHLVDMKRVSSKKEADKLAETHIKATFDIGHANTWRKYFKGTDDEFKKWMGKQVDMLNKNKIVGHVHVSDNFGYEDEHVSPGRGTTPIREMIDKFVKAGQTDIIVEAAEQDIEALTAGWGMIGKPIYGVANGGLGWGDIERSYFGQVAPPYFLYGDTAPSPQEWTLWSGTKLE